MTDGDDERPPESPRRKTRRRRSWTGWLIVAWLAVMAPLSFWGLPGRDRDDLLFGGEPPWEPERYQAARALEARRTRGAGADTDLDPLDKGDRIVELTATEGGRAEILRRYRLFTRQPDEMITLMALQRMDPRGGDFDPKLFQYGGAYIYLIGGLIGVGSLVGLTTLTGDINVYLARPELFAGLYMPGRFVSLAFGALTLIAAIRLGRLAGGRAAGWWAFLLVATCPVFITLALEAKPHLPSTCMILWAVLSALRFHAHGGVKPARLMGLQAGFAFGLVLTGLAAAAIAPVLALANRTDRRRWRLVAMAVAIAAGVYLATNPYVPLNLISDRTSLLSNVGNSTAMYSIGRLPEGALRVGELLIESCGAATLLLGVVGTVICLRRWPRETTIAGSSAGAMLLLCVAIGAGKPAEFARFLLLPATMLAIAAGVAVQAAFAKSRAGGVATAIVLAAAMLLSRAGTLSYLRSFMIDTWSQNESRRSAARFLYERAAPHDAVGVVQTQLPAPYGVPPLDFSHRAVYALPSAPPSDTQGETLPAWLVVAADDARQYAGAWWHAYYQPSPRNPAPHARVSRIAWANKPIFIYRLK